MSCGQIFKNGEYRFISNIIDSSIIHFVICSMVMKATNLFRYIQKFLKRDNTEKYKEKLNLR